MLQAGMLASLLKTALPEMPGIRIDRMLPPGEGIVPSVTGFDAQLEDALAQVSPQLLASLQQLLDSGMTLPEAARTLLVQRNGDDANALRELTALLAATETVNRRGDGGPDRKPVLRGTDAIITPPATAADRAVPPVAPSVAHADVTPRVPLPPVVAMAVPEVQATPPAAPVAVQATGGPPNPTAAPAMTPQLASHLLQMSVPEPVANRHWGAAIAERIVWMVQGDQQFASLKLNPPHLGPLEVRVSMSQDQASVAFLAQHAAVRDALEAALPRLREMFDQQSLQLVRADVGERGAERGDGTGDGPGRGQHAHAASVGDAAESDKDGTTAFVGGVTSSLVDLFA